jgi:hypothetical protein
LVAADPYDVGLLPHSLVLYYFKEECDETDAVMDELEDWCSEHAQGPWYARGYFGPGPYYRWFFQNKADAVLFKLTFGGVYVLNTAVSNA